MLKAGDYIGVTMTAAQIESDEPAVAIFLALSIFYVAVIMAVRYLKGTRTSDLY